MRPITIIKGVPLTKIESIKTLNSNEFILKSMTSLFDSFFKKRSIKNNIADINNNMYIVGLISLENCSKLR